MFCFLSGNMLKIIAAISMLIDHIGYMFFPDVIIFRIIGRLAFPIFDCRGVSLYKKQTAVFFDNIYSCTNLSVRIFLF